MKKINIGLVVLLSLALVFLGQRMFFNQKPVIETEVMDMSQESAEIEEEKTMAADEDKSEIVEVKNKGIEIESFELKDIDGNPVSLEELKGKKVYLKFWASWCSVCLAGMDELDELSGEENEFEVITIVSPSFNGEQAKEDFVKWFEGLNTKNIRVLMDEGGEITSRFNIRAYPTAAYIGSDGILVAIIPGHMGNSDIKEIFKKIY